jgi:hypothetical protein
MRTLPSPALAMGFLLALAAEIAACNWHPPQRATLDAGAHSNPSFDQLVARPLPNAFTLVDDSGLLASQPPFVGIIVPETLAREFGLMHGSAQSYFAPVPSDVLDLARAMREQLPRHNQHIASRFNHYRFQVVGAVRDGKRLLFVNGFCSAPADWQARPVLVKDGGDCYFRLSFDVAAGAIVEFEVNAEG